MASPALERPPTSGDTEQCPATTASAATLCSCCIESSSQQLWVWFAGFAFTLRALGGFSVKWSWRGVLCCPALPSHSSRSRGNLLLGRCRDSSGPLPCSVPFVSPADTERHASCGALAAAVPGLEGTSVVSVATGWWVSMGGTSVVEGLLPRDVLLNYKAQGSLSTKNCSIHISVEAE